MDIDRARHDLAAAPDPAAIPRHSWPARALRAAAATWLLAALAGQWAFFWYIASFYGRSTLSGDLVVWNRLAALGRTPYVEGDTGGNLAFAAHALGAGIVALGGALQLIPWLRARAPRFHRWNGRVFIATVVALSLSGYYLVWVRGTSPSTLDALSTSLNGALILGFAFLAYRSARARRLVEHRRWALRLYLVSNAQWFLRVGVFAYFVVNGLLGRKASFADPFLGFWTWGCYLVPLLLLEAYLRARDSGRAAPQAIVATLLFAITATMLLGMVAFAAFSQRLASGAPIAM
jgi:uncharacterized membrane protein